MNNKVRRLSENGYPRFFDNDDVPCRLDFNPVTRMVEGSTWSGHPIGVWKVLDGGSPIDQKTYEEAVKAYEDYIVEKKIDEKQFHAIISRLFGTQFFDT